MNIVSGLSKTEAKVTSYPSCTHDNDFQSKIIACRSDSHRFHDAHQSSIKRPSLNGCLNIHAQYG
jgi:hypothetical protein